MQSPAGVARHNLIVMDGASRERLSAPVMALILSGSFALLRMTDLKEQLHISGITFVKIRCGSFDALIPSL